MSDGLKPTDSDRIYEEETTIGAMTSTQSSVTMSLPSTAPAPPELDTQPESAPANSKPLGFIEDYIALLPSSDSEDDFKAHRAKKGDESRGRDPSRDEPRPSEREWDRGKPRERSRERGNEARKRKYDEADLEDGYANKKQRMNAASRKAPWVYDIEWDDCKNVAELCVVPLIYFLSWLCDYG